MVGGTERGVRRLHRSTLLLAMSLFEFAGMRRQLARLGALRCEDGPASQPSSSARAQPLPLYQPLADPKRHVTVVTTAAVPWMTGTAVNPLLRAGHLAEKRGPGMVTLLVPWVEVGDQRMLFPRGVTFVTPIPHHPPPPLPMELWMR